MNLLNLFEKQYAPGGAIPTTFPTSFSLVKELPERELCNPRRNQEEELVEYIFNFILPPKLNPRITDLKFMCVYDTLYDKYCQPPQTIIISAYMNLKKGTCTYFLILNSI